MRPFLLAQLLMHEHLTGWLAYCLSFSNNLISHLTILLNIQPEHDELGHLLHMACCNRRNDILGVSAHHKSSTDDAFSVFNHSQLCDLQNIPAFQIRKIARSSAPADYLHRFLPLCALHTLARHRNPAHAVWYRIHVTWPNAVHGRGLWCSKFNTGLTDQQQTQKAHKPALAARYETSARH